MTFERISVDRAAADVRELREVYNDEAIQIWLRSRNRNLDGQRPIDLLADNRIDEVLTEVASVVSGM